MKRVAFAKKGEHDNEYVETDRLHTRMTRVYTLFIKTKWAYISLWIRFLHTCSKKSRDKVVLTKAVIL